MRLRDRVAVVTGAASGVGRATAFLFAREGARVMCADVDGPMVQETAEIIRGEGGAADAVVADLSDAAQTERMAAACMDWSGCIDVLFNNAGWIVRAPFGEVSLEDWNRHIAINLTAPFHLSQLLLPALKASNAASVIHHGSIDGVLGNPTIAAYSAAKGGLIPLTHVMAHTLGPLGIRVNCINSGAIRLSDQGIVVRLSSPRKAGDEMSDTQRQVTPLRRPGKVEEVAYAALYLASDESAYTSGSVVTLDGGRTGVTPGTF